MYTVGELAALDAERRIALRDTLVWQMSDEGRPVGARRWAAEALAVLAKVGLAATDRPGGIPRIPPRADDPASVEARVQAAREALYGPVEVGHYEDPAGRSVQQRVEDARAFLRPPVPGTRR